MAILQPKPVPTPSMGSFTSASSNFFNNARPANVAGPGIGIYGPQDSYKQKSTSGVLGAQTSYAGPTQGPSFSPNITAPNQPFSGSGGPSEIDAINDQFNQFNSYLDTQAGTAQNNFNETKSLYDTQKANTEQQYNTERATQTDQTKKTEALNLSKVRQLLGDLSQRNAARTAITGGGSASEALGERFGRQAQSSLGGVMDATKQTLDRINQFYDTAVTKLNESYNANILSAKQSLDENLSNISAARTQSASAKQASTIDAWRNYYNTVNQAKVQAAQFKAQYDMWNQQQQSAYGATAGFKDSNMGQYGQDLSQAYNNFQQTPGVNNQQATAINPYFQTKSKQTNEEDPLYGGAPSIA